MRLPEQPAPESRRLPLDVLIPGVVIAGILAYGMHNAIRDLLEGRAPKSVPVATYTPSTERERGQGK